MSEQFLRAEMLLGSEAMEKLAQSHVAVFGLGGVGSWCAEALCRCGVGKLTLVDEDTVSESNLNRQLCATVSALFLPKAEVMARRLLDINPQLTVIPVCARYEEGSRERFFTEKFDYIADCIDLVSCKLDLIETALSRKIPIISSLGTGNKMDAEALRISDISQTMGCPFARVMRKELRSRGISTLPVVWSPEPAMKPQGGGEPPPGRRSIPGSLVWVPASAGMLISSHIVKNLIK